MKKHTTILSALLLAAALLTLHASAEEPKGDTKILFLSDAAPKGWCLMLPDGSGVEPLTSKTKILVRYPTQDPQTVGEGQTKKVVAVAAGKAGLSALTLADSETAKPRVLIEDASEKTIPRLAPGEGLVAYLATNEGATRLAVIAPGGRAPKYLVDGHVKNYVWSSDGKQLAFVSNDGDDGSLQVSTIKADGTARTRVTDGKVPPEAIVPEWLAWSPDGQALAYFRRSGEGTGLCVAKLAEPAKEAEWLTKYKVEATSLEMSWSPDSKKIALCWYGVSPSDPKLADHPDLGMNEGIFVVSEGAERHPFKIVKKDAKQPRFVKVKTTP